MKQKTNIRKTPLHGISTPTKTQVLLFILFLLPPLFAGNVLVETELFQQKGGWITETQFIDQMGSPYLMAHGLGQPVDDARTTIVFEKKGKYHWWVRTKDWAPFPQGPGRFQVLLDGVPSETTFGSSGKTGWHWEYGGSIRITAPEIEVRLHDMTGFDGRCDAIFFSTNKSVKLPETPDELHAFRKEHLNAWSQEQDEGQFDLIVAGGGVAGICTALQAARLGVKVALLDNRPVLGGNSSSERRIYMDGDVFRNKYPQLGKIVRELDNHTLSVKDDRLYGYCDQWRESIVKNEKNITLFKNMHVTQVTVKDGQIESLGALNLTTLETHRFHGKLFADCTGDAQVGILAGADYRYGRESQSETGEMWAPATPDNLVMGTSNQWHSRQGYTATDFPQQSWMLNFTDEYHFDIQQSQFNWETGFNNFHTVRDAEEIRDHNFRAIYGNWAYLKTHKPEKYAKRELDFLAHVAGKRESYRLLGDVILKQQDITEKKDYPDAVVTTTWGIDLHYPDSLNSIHFPAQEFISYALHLSKQADVYTFPYRCLYSRNIENLFMAGRNISVTHIALGAIRVQRCTGMMGEVVGLAAYLCKKHQCTPREIYTAHWDELIELIEGKDM